MFVEVRGERAVELLGSCNSLSATLEVFVEGLHRLHRSMLSGCLISGASVDESSGLWGSRG
jgi:hypothetical protein